MKRQNYKFYWMVFLVASILAGSGCKPTDLPGLRQIAESEDKRMQKEAEEKIKTVPVFSELNQLCSQEIPIYDGFSLVQIYSFGKTDSISYNYHSNADWQDVKTYYKNYFTDHNWTMTEEYESSLFDSKVEFRKGNYRVTLSTTHSEDFSFYCQKMQDKK